VSVAIEARERESLVVLGAEPWSRADEKAALTSGLIRGIALKAETNPTRDLDKTNTQKRRLHHAAVTHFGSRDAAWTTTSGKNGAKPGTTGSRAA
jgi:hypothetical protein